MAVLPYTISAGNDADAEPVQGNFDALNNRVNSIESVIDNITVDADTYANGVFPNGLTASEIGTQLSYSPGTAVISHILFYKTSITVDFSGYAADTYYVEMDSAGDTDIYTSSSAARTNLNTVVWNGTSFDSVTTADRNVLATYQEIIDARGAEATLEDRLDTNDTRVLGIEAGTTALTKVLTPEIKTDTTTPTDLNIVTGAQKTLLLDTAVYEDMRIVPGSFDRPGVSDPAYVAYDVNGGGVSTYLTEWAVNDLASFTVQLPHTYKEGTDLDVHIHWTPGANGVSENGNLVGWKVQYSWVNINGNFDTMATADLSDACDGTDHKHQRTAPVAITGTGKEISSMLICNIIRTDTGADDTWAGTAAGSLPMLLEVDFHYQIDTVGSRQPLVK